MADFLSDNQTAPTSPSSSKSIWWNDSTTKKFVQTDDAGVHHGILSTCYSAAGVASQTAVGAADTYITSSGLLLPAYGMQVGMLFRWWINLFKTTSTGTATPIWSIRIGGAQSTADTARLTLTGTAASSGVGGGLAIVEFQVRTVSGSGVIVGNFMFPNTNMGSGQTSTGVSSTFDNTLTIGGQYVGLSLNPGTNTVYTVDSIRGELSQ